MAARLLSVVPSQLASSVAIEWDADPGLHLARCDSCAAHLRSSWLGAVEVWAEEHRCDPELATLLAETNLRRAA
ncbi:hypothetical protein AB0L06_10770 [Spirillospora sp. NPDC052269]